MTTLADVSNFAVDSECLFTWDAVANAEGYELRTGTDWENSTPLIGVNISGTSFQYSEPLDAVDVFIKAKALSYVESLNAAQVTTAAIIPIALVQNISIASDEITFDLVASATSYEIRRSKGENVEVNESAFVATVPDNTPYSIPNNAGYRYYIRAHGVCNTRSESFSTIFSAFETGGCGPVEPPNGPQVNSGMITSNVLKTYPITVNVFVDLDQTSALDPESSSAWVQLANGQLQYIADTDSDVKIRLDTILQLVTGGVGLVIELQKNGVTFETYLNTVGVNPTSVEYSIIGYTKATKDDVFKARIKNRTNSTDIVGRRYQLEGIQRSL